MAHDHMYDCRYCSGGPVAFHGPDPKNLLEVARLVKKFNKQYRKQDVDSIVSYLNGLAWAYGNKGTTTYVGASGVIFTFFNGPGGYRECKMSIDPIILTAKPRNKKAA
jgi:hypothetical protein